MMNAMQSDNVDKKLLSMLKASLDQYLIKTKNLTGELQKQLEAHEDDESGLYYELYEEADTPLERIKKTYEILLLPEFKPYTNAIKEAARIYVSMRNHAFGGLAERHKDWADFDNYAHAQAKKHGLSDNDISIINKFRNPVDVDVLYTKEWQDEMFRKAKQSVQ